jgi:hypothetical protein
MLARRVGVGGGEVEGKKGGGQRKQPKGGQADNFHGCNLSNRAARGNFISKQIYRIERSAVCPKPEPIAEAGGVEIIRRVLRSTGGCVVETTRAPGDASPGGEIIPIET